jgi:PAS domain-containing protein
VTTLALTRDALTVSESHQRAIIATLAEGVIVVDAFGACTESNPAAARILGLDGPEQLIGLHADLMPMVDNRLFGFQGGVRVSRSAQFGLPA